MKLRNRRLRRIMAGRYRLARWIDSGGDPRDDPEQHFRPRGGFDISTWLFFLPLLLLLAAAWIAFAGLRQGVQLQRRLFLLFLVFSLLPTLIFPLLSWKTSQRHLKLAESPGLHQSLESAVQIARELRELRREQCRQQIDRCVQTLSGGEILTGLDFLPEGEGCRYLLRRTDGAILASSDSLLISQIGSREVGEPDSLGVSIHLAEGSADLLARKLPGNRELWMAFPVDSVQQERIESVARGYSNLGQLHLYYTEGLRVETLFILLSMTFLLLCSALILSRILARQIASPLKELTEGTRKVATGDLEHQVRIHAVDELGELVDAFNLMTSRLRQSQIELRRSERLAAWQDVARRLAHEIKNPLTPIHLSLHRLRQRTENDQMLECLDAIAEETENLKRLADEFSLYARLPEPELRPCFLRPLMEQVVELYGHREGLRIEWEDFPGELEALADEGQLRQVFSNLIKNAIEAMPDGGAVFLGASLEEGNIRLRIRDEGSGLPVDAEKLFEPDFSTKLSGSGLGLAISRKILEDHGGSIRADGIESGGSVFEILLPRTASAEKSQPE